MFVNELDEHSDFTLSTMFVNELDEHSDFTLSTMFVNELDEHSDFTLSTMFVNELDEHSNFTLSTLFAYEHSGVHDSVRGRSFDRKSSSLSFSSSLWATTSGWTRSWLRCAKRVPKDGVSFRISSAAQLSSLSCP